ncbi:phosphate ABC transporter substrate-binding protein PstS [Microbacterium sp. CJ88]|uniref:phosphate ABC transporter substrate-binding protein PstS n=1 Tax=Microbacterium sp. CJ88 TaxID=3445672 RepID=UPI003F65C41C
MNARTRTYRYAAVALVLTLVGLGSTPAQAATYDPISGSGSTWSENALSQWRKDVGQNYGMTVNYRAEGSTVGRSDFIKQQVDFAISEIPFQLQPEDNSPPEVSPVKFAYMPIVAGGTSLMYNLKIGGKRVTNLRLSGETIAKIFTGAITKWNDPAIATDNPALAMPDRAITPVYRSDGSGTSAQFTLWMSKQFPSIWTYGMRSQFPAVTPAFKGQKGSDGVSAYVSQDYGEGAITYAEYSYAVKAGFPVAKVLNKSGYYVEPTYQSVAVALMNAKINGDLTQNLDDVYNSGDPRSYPMSSYSYLIVPLQTTTTLSTSKGTALSVFASYMICEGQQKAATLGYSPLPMNLVRAASAVIAQIPGSAGEVDLNKCNNPTFKPGDSESSNQLAATAPNPPDCDRQGPTQCLAGTGGAPAETPATGNGGVAGGGSGATGGGAGTTDAAATGAAAGAATGASDAVYDANGNLVSGSGSSGAAAVSSPFSLAQDGWGTAQTLMLVAGVLLIAATLAPPFLVRALRRDKRG